MTVLLILASVTLSALAQIAFKLGVSSAHVREGLATSNVLAMLIAFSTSLGILTGLALYGIGTLLWLNVLARTELSQAYPFVGLGFVLTAILGYLLFNDSLGLMRLIGTALVIAGITLVAWS